MKPLAVRIRDAILKDVTDRRGWRQEWDQFGDDIQGDIRESWLLLIETEIRRDPGAGGGK